MTEQQQQPANEGAFALALGLNPDEVQAGTVHVEFTRAGAIVRWDGQKVVSHAQAGVAFLQSTGVELREDKPEGEGAEDGVTPIKRPAAKRPADRKPKQQKDGGGE